MPDRQILTSYRDLDTEAVDGALIGLNPYKRRKAERAIQDAFHGHEKASVICDESSSLVRNTTRHGFKISFMLTQSTFKVMEISEKPNDPSDDDSDGYFIIKRNGRLLNFPLHSKALGDCRCSLILIDSIDLIPKFHTRDLIMEYALKAILGIGRNVLHPTISLYEGRKTHSRVMARRLVTFSHEASHQVPTTLTLRSDRMVCDYKRLSLIRRAAHYWASFACLISFGIKSRMMAETFGRYADEAHGALIHTELCAIEQRLSAQIDLLLAEHVSENQCAVKKGYSLSGQQEADPWCSGELRFLELGSLIVVDPKGEFVTSGHAYRSVISSGIPMEAAALRDMDDGLMLCAVSPKAKNAEQASSQGFAHDLGMHMDNANRTIPHKFDDIQHDRGMLNAYQALPTAKPCPDANHSAGGEYGRQEHRGGRGSDAFSQLSMRRVSNASQTHFGSIDMLKRRNGVVLKSQETETFSNEVRAKEIWWDRCNLEKKGGECTNVNNVNLIQNNENLERLAMANNQVTERPLNWHQ